MTADRQCLYKFSENEKLWLWPHFVGSLVLPAADDMSMSSFIYF